MSEPNDYPEPRLAPRPEADYGDEDRGASAQADRNVFSDPRLIRMVLDYADIVQHLNR